MAACDLEPRNAYVKSAKPTYFARYLWCGLAESVGAVHSQTPSKHRPSGVIDGPPVTLGACGIFWVEAPA